MSLFLIFSLSPVSWSQTNPTMSSQQRTYQLEEDAQALTSRIEKKKESPDIEKEKTEEPVAPDSSERVLIKDIVVTGGTYISGKEIDKITAPSKNKNLTIRDMQVVADKITDVYRQKGYITSRAYLPPQKIENNILNIIVVEGKAGSIDIKGNKYFSTKYLLSKITLKKGDPFNYNNLRKDMVKINQSPDCFSRAVLVPGKDPGETDISLEVKDHMPIHAGLSWDNYGSRYIDGQRYSTKLIDNNFLGFGDVLSFEYQLAQSSRYFLKDMRYFIPLKHGWGIGMFASLSRVKLGQEFEDLDVRGKSNIYGVFANKSLIDTENLDLGLSLGFDYKNITNYQTGAVASQDRLRIAKFGLDFDLTDNFGRTIINNEVDMGIPNIMGGLHKASATTSSSRSGAGGNFTKNTTNIVRLQKMPLSSNILWKSQIQQTSNVLTAAEQFQIGGIVNVRGYPPAEVVGDSGYSTTVEWNFPIYGLSKNAGVPLSKAKLYDALRAAIFYDWANAHLKRPLSNEGKNRTLRSAGFGFRFNLPEDFSAKVDFAWPLDNAPSDGDRLHIWVQISKNF